MVPRLLIQELGQVIPDGAVVLGVHILFDIPEHLHDLGVGAAVERTLQGPHRPGDGAVSIRPAGGQGPADKGGVVAAAVLCVDHEHHVQQVGLFLRVLGVGADHPQKVLRRGQPLHGEVDVERAPFKVMALHRVGVGHDAGEGPHQLHRLEQDIVQGGVVRVFIIGVEGQHAPGQLVHDIPAGIFHNHVLGEAVGQLPRPVHDLIETVQFPPGGQIAHEQQIGHLFKAKGPRLPVGLHDLIELNAPVIQLAGYRNADTVLNHVPQHRTHPGDADGHAGSVAVSQAPLDVPSVELFPDVVFLFNAVAQGTCVLFQDPGPILLHSMVPLSSAVSISQFFLGFLFGFLAAFVLFIIPRPPLSCKKKFLPVISFGKFARYFALFPAF